LYFSISEVAQITDLQPYILRTWEKEFPCLRPRRLRGKNRAYRQRDINLILLIKRLLYEERFTIQGVRQKLRNDAELVRQAIGRDGLGDREVEPEGEAEVQEEVPGSAPVSPEEALPQAAGPAADLRALEEVKAELRAILQLLS
jgi:DNA-binding transcriptional MerR regulator